MNSIELSWADQYFSSFSHRKDPYSLRDIQRVLQLVDNVHQKIPCIHVAGTNGKGSVCALLTNIFGHHGHKVGTYTSPHILTVRERIRLQGEPISEEKIKKLVERYESYFKGLSYFEVLTLCGFLFFYEEKVDIAIIETGLGGRLDATNVITPLVSVITSISMDHKQHLGDTLENIAFEKAGIIKKQVPVVTSVTQENIVKILEEKSKAENSAFYRLCEDFSYEMSFHRYPKKNDLFYNGITRNFEFQDLSLWNTYQPQNFSCVLAVLEVLWDHYQFEEKLIQKSIKDFFWPARFQMMQENPLIIFDVAHNPGGILELVDSLKKFFSWGKLYFLLGISADKDWGSMLKMCEGLSSHIGVACYEDTRSWSVESLPSHYSRFVNLKEGFDFFCKNLKHHDILCVTGSFHTISEVQRKSLQCKSIF
ncbi:MAG: bifunctional folylpolyglutamate synthase/dihydrofolate synthase [Deltaproteobacteria bacterium]|nr:bifunctional folylpolyglutamate synthase/dihydrofolate synthase [Deltaproteobacteria bacterium]